MQSKEYPDLPFVPPRAFGTGRPWASTPRVIVIHYTAGSERSTSAEDGAAYDQRRTDGVSTHYFVDRDSVIQCVYTWDRANAALYNGNRIGIQYELCGTVQTRAQWLDAASDATLTLAARQVARDCRKYGIPVRKLTPAQVAGGERGICGHADITLAFPADNGTHMDPGKDFPWDIFLARVQAALGGETEDDMTPEESARLSNIEGMLTRITQGIPTTDKGYNVLAEHVRQILAGDPRAANPGWGNGLGLNQAHGKLDKLLAAAGEDAARDAGLRAQLDAALAALRAMAETGGADIAPAVAAIREVGGRVDALSAQLTAAERERDELRVRLAAALGEG